MVRERVGDWRSVWRFALAGLVAGILVVATSQTAVVAPLFFALQDQLFPAPPPSAQVTLVAIDPTGAGPFGPYPWGNDIHAKVINSLASLHPKVILFDVMLDHSGPGDAQLAKAISNAGNVVLVCTADDPPLPMFARAAAAVAGRELGVPDPANAVRGVPAHIAKSCTDNPSGEPAFIQAVRIAEGTNDPFVTNGNAAELGRHIIPLVNGEMLINFTDGKSPTCGYLLAFNGRCPAPSLITNHIVAVGIKLVDADAVYATAGSFGHHPPFSPP